MIGRSESVKMTLLFCLPFEGNCVIRRSAWGSLNMDVFYVVARGTTIQTICGSPFVTGTNPITGTTISVFVVRPRVFPVPVGLMRGVHGRFARTAGNKENRAAPGWVIQPNDTPDRRRLVGVDRTLSPIPLSP